MNNDVIIIGSGLGGLVAGAKLAKEGKRVLVIEQHSVPGGYSTSFTQKGYTIDVGLNSMDGLYEKDPKLDIFEDLDVYYSVEFVKVPTGYYRFKNGRKDFSLPDNRKEAIETLTEQFPDEKKGIKNYFDTIEQLTKDTHDLPRSKLGQLLIGPVVPILYSSIPRWGRRTIGDLLDILITNQDLKLALLGPLLYYSDDPYKLSAVIYSLAQSSNFKGGSYYIKGGSMKLSSHFAEFIKQHGGTVLLNHKVSKIIVENGKACGVEYLPTNNLEAIPVKSYSNYVIANAAVTQVANELLPEDQAVKLKQQIDGLEIGHSTTNIYFGFNIETQILGHRDYYTYVNEEFIVNLQDLARNPLQDYSKRNFVFIDYGQLDSGMAPAGKSVGMISFIDYFENWDNLSKEEYTIKKKKVQDIFIDRLNKLIPGIKDHIEYIDLATPITKQRFTLNPRGTSIGWAQTRAQAGMNRLKSKSIIKNLYFASAWTFPGGGFSSTIWSGWQCAIDLLQKLKE